MNESIFGIQIADMNIPATVYDDNKRNAKPYYIIIILIAFLPTKKFRRGARTKIEC